MKKQPEIVKPVAKDAKKHPLLNLGTFSIALRHTIMKKVTANKLKAQTFNGLHIKSSTPPPPEEDPLFAGLGLEFKSKFKEDDEAMKLKRRKGKLDNNYAVFSNDIYSNFLKIKNVSFDFFLKLIEIYKIDRSRGMKLTFEKYSYRKVKPAGEETDSYEDSDLSGDGEEFSDGYSGEEESYSEDDDEDSLGLKHKLHKNKYLRVGYKIGNPTQLMMVRNISLTQ